MRAMMGGLESGGGDGDVEDQNCLRRVFWSAKAVLTIAVLVAIRLLTTVRPADSRLKGRGIQLTGADAWTLYVASRGERLSNTEPTGLDVDNLQVPGSEQGSLQLMEYLAPLAKPRLFPTRGSFAPSERIGM